MKNKLRPYLHDVLGTATEAECHLSALPHGTWNENYLLDRAGERFVVKVYVSQASNPNLLMSNSGQREFATLRHLAPLDIAPQPVHFDDPAPGVGYPVLIYRYVPGEILAYTPAVAETMAEVYARLHKHPLPQTYPWPPRREQIGPFLAHLRQAVQNFSQRADVSADVAAPWQFYLAESEARLAGQADMPFEPALLHGDPVASNIIVGQSAGGPKISLIDWQSPTLGDPAYDVWAFTAPAFTLWDQTEPPSPAQIAAFEARYLAGRPDPTLRERIAVKAPLYLLEYGLHCAQRYQDYLSAGGAGTAGHAVNLKKYGPTIQQIQAELARRVGRG